MEKPAEAALRTKMCVPDRGSVREGDCWFCYLLFPYLFFSSAIFPFGQTRLNPLLHSIAIPSHPVLYMSIVTPHFILSTYCYN